MVESTAISLHVPGKSEDASILILMFALGGLHRE